MKIRMYVFAICLQFYGCLYVAGINYENTCSLAILDE